jgi:cytochrome c553
MLAGQHAAYIEKQLRDWRNGTRANDAVGMMPAIARALTDQDIAALAAYLSATAPRTAATAP